MVIADLHRARIALGLVEQGARHHLAGMSSGKSTALTSASGRSRFAGLDEADDRAADGIARAALAVAVVTAHACGRDEEGAGLASAS